MFNSAFNSTVCAALAGVTLWAGGLTALPASAETLPSPQGDILLTVTGNLTNTNAEGAAQFDLAMLESLPVTEFSTSTVWTDDVQRFEGVALAHLIEVLGIDGTQLHATAVNDYGIDIPIKEIDESGPIVAYRMNGKTMSLRDKGPLWIVYPYDSSPEMRSEVIYSRSIWQLDRIEAQD